MNIYFLLLECSRRTVRTLTQGHIMTARFIGFYFYRGGLYHFSADSNKDLYQEMDIIMSYPNDKSQNTYKTIWEVEDFDEDYVVYKITEKEITQRFSLIDEIRQGVLELQSSKIENKQDFDNLVYENNIWYPLPDLYKYFDLKNVEEMIKNNVLNNEAKKYIISNDLCDVDFKTKETPEPNEIV